MVIPMPAGWKAPATQFGSWKEESARLDLEQAIAWMEQGGNIGIAGTADDELVNVDIDDEDETDIDDLQADADRAVAIADRSARMVLRRRGYTQHTDGFGGRGADVVAVRRRPRLLRRDGSRDGARGRAGARGVLHDRARRCHNHFNAFRASRCVPGRITAV
jgi:Bifunctional DNA primase/polymerase, N-terminal.